MPPQQPFTPRATVVLCGLGAGEVGDWMDAMPPQWRCVAVPDGAAGPPLDQRLTAVLDHPDTPDRVLLVAAGAAGVAAAQAASEDHPERVAGLIAVGVAAGPGRTVRLPAGSPAAEGVALLVPLAQTLAGATAPVPPRLIPPTAVNDRAVMEGLRAAGEVHRLEGDAAPWVLTGHDVTVRVMADPRLAGARELTAGYRLSAERDPAHRGEQDLITIDAPAHAALRRLVAAHLTPRRAEAQRGLMAAASARLLDTLPPDAPVDLLDGYARPFPIVVLCETIGIPAQHHGYVQDWLIRRMTAWPPDPHRDVDELVAGLIETRAADPRDDLISAALVAEGDALDPAELVDAVRWLLVAGHRAPTTVLANGVAALLRDRPQWELLCARPELLESAAAELLRHVSPFPLGLARHAAAPLAVGGTTIERGDLVAASLVAANHDPTYFDEPGRLDITRAPNPHLAFGHGHHYCVGAALARVQLEVALRQLTSRYPRLALAAGPDRLQYRQNRVQYLLELPVLLDPDATPHPDGGDRPAAAPGARPVAAF